MARASRRGARGPRGRSAGGDSRRARRGGAQDGGGEPRLRERLGHGSSSGRLAATARPAVGHDEDPVALAGGLRRREDLDLAGRRRRGPREVGRPAGVPPLRDLVPRERRGRGRATNSRASGRTTRSASEPSGSDASRDAGHAGPLGDPRAAFPTRTGRTLERPMNVATNRVAGCSKSSSGVPTCSRRPAFRTRDAVAELEGLLLLVRHEERRDADLAGSRASTPGGSAREGTDRGSRAARRAAERAARARARGRARRAAAGRRRSPSTRRVSNPARPDERRAPPRRARAASPREGALRLEAEGHVLSDRQVGEERVVLEDHAEAALLGRQAVTSSPSTTISPGVRSLEARDEAQHRRLAAARRPEQGHDLARAPADERDAARDGGARRSAFEALRAVRKSESLRPHYSTEHEQQATPATSRHEESTSR